MFIRSLYAKKREEYLVDWRNKSIFTVIKGLWGAYSLEYKEEEVSELFLYPGDLIKKINQTN